MAEKYANNAVTTLTLSISAAQTTISVASNDGFPIVTTASGDFFYVLIGQELLKVTNNPTTLWTVQRGVQGSVAAIADAGANVYCVVTKETFENLIASATITPIAIASLPVAGSTGKVYTPTNSFYPLIYDNGSQYLYFMDGKQVTRPLEASNWTVVTAGNATLTNSGGGLLLSTASNTTANMEAFIRAIPATPYTITVKLNPLFLIDGGSETISYGLFVANGNLTTSAIHCNRIYSTAFSNQWLALQSATFTSYAFAGQANTVDFINFLSASPQIWMQISDDGTNRILRVSVDGVNYITYATLGRTTPFTATHYGVFAQCSVTGRPWGLSIPTISTT